ncbi:MAG: helicase-related protein, partial [Opitutae bacterium]
YLPNIVQQLLTHARHRKILVFLPLIATSKKFAALCNKAGLKAKHLDGQSENRREILNEFSMDGFQVLCNAMLLTEGYDEPDVDCVVILRPTRSRPLFCQMVGRGTRVSEFKEDLLLLDFLWNHEKHNLIRPAHLIAETEDTAKLITKQLERNSRGGKQEELDLQDLATEANLEREEKLAEELKANAKRKASERDVLEFCLSLHKPNLADFEPTMKWESEPMSEAQRALLEKNGVNPDGVKGAGHASKLIDLIISRSKMNLATPKQVRLMRRFGHKSPESASFDEASAFIGLRIGRARKKQTQKGCK